MPSSGYSSGEMLRMQQDAIRRVQEMQRRANANLAQTSIPTPPAQPPPRASAPPPEPTPQETTASTAGEESPSPTGLGSIFSTLLGGNVESAGEGILAQLGVDEEQAFILLLLLMLLREGTDQKLLLALCYLLL